MLADYVKHKILKYCHNQSKVGRYPLLAVPSNDYIGQAAMINGYYENDLLKPLARLIEENEIKGTCLDVGANIGNHSAFFPNTLTR